MILKTTLDCALPVTCHSFIEPLKTFHISTDSQAVNASRTGLIKSSLDSCLKSENDA